MENPPPPADNQLVLITALPSPEKKPPRRRFVQKTLFPLKPHHQQQNDKTEIKKAEEIIHVDDDDGGDNNVGCGTPGKGKKRGRKPKGFSTPQKRTPKNKKAAANGEDDMVVEVDGFYSPENGSPMQQKGKQSVSKRNGRTNGSKGSSRVSTPTRPVSIHRDSKPPDLWLEAKKTAEENSRLFAGKQLHPFFSSWKTGKKDQETAEVESNGCLSKRKERHTELAPIHVFENTKDGSESIDWSNWTLTDEIFSNSIVDQETSTSSAECRVDFSNSDSVLCVSNCFRTLTSFEDVSLGESPGPKEGTSAVANSASPIVVDIEVTLNDLMINLRKDFDIDKLGFISGKVVNGSSDREHQKPVLEESLVSYYLNRGNHPENSLWTIKYQPEKASQVCGNSEGVKFINEWLGIWHATDFRVRKRSSTINNNMLREDSYGSYVSDSDRESEDEGSDLKNVLLVTGAVGSGKSAAIYACAKEQGFQVIEVNASDWRNGAILKQKFGEAVGSHRLKRCPANPVGSQDALDIKTSPLAGACRTLAFDLNKDAEVISLSEEEDSTGGLECVPNDILPCSQDEIKTLILFEDVDATLCEDRGFISSIQLLAETGKRPMILTCNGENPVLPDSLDREHICFIMPSFKELTQHIYLVCAAEKVNIEPKVIERCIEICRGDIRKTLTHLQFWCQSKKLVKDGVVRHMQSPSPFSLEAGHCTLPKLIPWELPSSLAEFVEAEIANTLRSTSMEETLSWLGLVEEEVGYCRMEKDTSCYQGEASNVEAMKEAILRGNNFINVENDVVAVSATCELINFTDSPVAFARRNVRRKLKTVLSDSEDEIPVVSVGRGDRDSDYHSAPATDFISSAPVMDCSNMLAIQPLSEAVNAEAKPPSETAKFNLVNVQIAADSCNQSTDHCAHFVDGSQAEIQHRHGSWETANNFLNMSTHSLIQETEVSRRQMPVMHNVDPNLSALGNFIRQPTDQVGQLWETDGKVKETEKGNQMETADMSPLVHGLQHSGELKTTVNRCLFPPTPQIDLVGCTLESSQNQPTGQHIFSGPLNMAQSLHQHLEEGTVNFISQEVENHSSIFLFDQFQCRDKSNIEDTCSHQETENVDESSLPAVDDLQKLSNSLLFGAESSKEEVLNQDLDSRSLGHISPKAVVDSLNQLIEEPLIRTEVEEIKLQDSPAHNDQFVKEMKTGIFCQISGDAVLQVTDCQAAGSLVHLLDGKTHQVVEENAEESQFHFSEPTDINQFIDQCQSVDMSYVPESTFVPETEFISEIDYPSQADMTEIVSPIVDAVQPSSLGQETCEYVRCCSVANLTVGDEEMGDSHSETELLEASTSGCQLMDECSRMDFCRRSKSFRRSRLPARNMVVEKWNEIRQTDLSRYLVSENKHALQLVKLVCGISNFMSESELLLHDCEIEIQDSLDQLVDIGEEKYGFGWHDQGLQMGSIISEHGFCSYAKDIISLQLKMGLDNKVHLAWEMLASTNNLMALGKLLRLGRSRSYLAGQKLEEAAPLVNHFFSRERETCLQNVALSVVPLRSHLALRANALHDYLSSLAHMSRSEASRLYEAAEKTKRRRVRVARNYLTSGGLDLSLDDIVLLKEYSNYGIDS